MFWTFLVLVEVNVSSSIFFGFGPKFWFWSKFVLDVQKLVWTSKTFFELFWSSLKAIFRLL